MKKKVFAVMVALAAIGICAIAGASPPPHQAGIAVVAATADNFVDESSSEPAGMPTRGVWAMAQTEVTLAPIMTPSGSSSITAATTMTHRVRAMSIVSATINPTRDPEVVDLCRYRYAAGTAPRYYLDDGTRATVVNHPLRS